MTFIFFILLLLLAEKGIHKLATVEHTELVDALADTYISYGNMELVADADYHTALGCAVELGDGERCNLRSLRKLTCLLKGVLSRRAIQHEHNLVRSVGNNLRHHVANLRKLVHQSDLIMQTACSVDQHHVGAICYCRLECIVGH